MIIRNAWLLILVCATAHAALEADYTVYHRKDDIFQIVEDTVGGQHEPKAMAITTQTAQDGNYTSELLVVTVEPGGLTGKDDSKVRLIWDFGQHGRELIPSEVALKLLALLADEAKLADFCKQQRIPAQPLLASLRHTVLKIIPMENVRGRELVEGGQACLRKNGRGVDTNRNWGVHWGFKESDYDPEEEFPGTKPFSEPEAAMMRALAEGFRPHCWVNVHSGMEALFMPYDHRKELPQGPGPAAALAILQALNQTACGGRCAVGSGAQFVGYRAHGTATDYMFEELHVPLSFTWEIYGDAGATFEECFRMFNPSGRAAFDKVVDTWVSAFLRLILLLPTHPDVARDVPAMAAIGQQLAADQVQRAVANVTAKTTAPLQVLPRTGGSDGAGIRRGAEVIVPAGKAPSAEKTANTAGAAAVKAAAAAAAKSKLPLRRSQLLDRTRQFGLLILSVPLVIGFLSLLRRRSMLTPRGRFFVRRRAIIPV